MTPVEGLGEHEIIEIIAKCLNGMPNTPIPFGDDVTAVDIDGEKLAVIKTDMLVRTTDAPPLMNLWQMARKAVVMNVSDFAAKGVKPIALLASIGAPRSLTKSDFEQIGKGLNYGAREYGAYVLGGDTNEASDLVISCSAFGLCDKKYLMTRSRANPGDVLAVTGLFGKSAAGLKILLEGLSVPVEDEKLTDAVLMPQARLREGLALACTQSVTASIDSSDGLAWSIYELSKSSRVGFIVDFLPVAEEVTEFAEKQNIEPSELVLYGGEEYELVVTVKPKLWREAEEALRKIGTPLTRIGIVTEEPTMLLKTESLKAPIEARGWEHFKKPIQDIQ